MRSKGFRHSEETKRKISLAHLGKIATLEQRKKLSEAHRGQRRPHTESTKVKMREIALKRIADGTHNWWKGGITKLNKAIRNSSEYKLWRKAVFERDNYTCRFCKVRGGELQADHIKPFALFPELRFAIDNGRSLCKPCHITTETYAKPFRITK